MDKPNASTEIKMDAYIIMLHLRSQGWISFTEIVKRKPNKYKGLQRFIFGMETNLSRKV